MNIEPRYLAGLLDGEGYFGLMRRRGTENGYERQGFTPAVKIGLTAKDDYILNAIQAQYGGYIDKRGPSGSTKASTQWQLKGKAKLKPFLPIVIPYLILKQEQAELLLEFCEMPYAYRRLKDKAIWNRAVEIHERMFELKGRLPATTE